MGHDGIKAELFINQKVPRFWLLTRHQKRVFDKLQVRHFPLYKHIMNQNTENKDAANGKKAVFAAFSGDFCVQAQTIKLAKRRFDYAG